MITIRMRRCGIDRTLHDYIFTDREHARQWLLQKPSRYVADHRST